MENLQIHQTISEYTHVQLKAIVEKLRHLHAIYPLDVPLNRKAHEFFHKIYGYESTPDDFYKFTIQYYEVDFNTFDFPKIKIPKRKRNALTDEEVVEIYNRRKNGESCLQISKDFGVSGSRIENIVNGKTYKHLNLDPINEGVLPWKMVMEIREALIEGTSGVELSIKYGVSTSVISSIRRGSSGSSQSSYKELVPLPTGRRKGKLTEEDVRKIREKRKSDNAIDIAQNYGISRQLVNDIVTGRRYKHII